YKQPTAHDPPGQQAVTVSWFGPELWGRGRLGVRGRAHLYLCLFAICHLPCSFVAVRSVEISSPQSWPMTRSAPSAFNLERASDRAPRHSVQHFVSVSLVASDGARC